MRRRRESGFALLAALLVAALAAVFAGVAIAAALGALGVAASDAGQTRARAVAEAAASLAMHRICWVLVPRDAQAEYGVHEACDPQGRCRVTIASVDDPASEALRGLGPFMRVTADGSSGKGRSLSVVLLALRPAALPLGMSVVEDAEVSAPVVVSGVGLYVGGSLRGREWVAFQEHAGVPDAGGPLDLVHGDRWPMAGVHAGGGIWAAGLEIHDLDPLPSGFTADSDGHAVKGDVADLVALPDAVWLASARAHGLEPAAALVDGVLRLDRLPPAPPTGEPGSVDVAGSADPSAGYLVCVSARGLNGGLSVTGRRPLDWPPITVVIEGDANLVDVEGEAVSGPDADPALAFGGALVVTGHLTVSATTRIAGHLACRRLVVAAPLALAVGEEWRARSPVGSLEAVLVARE